MGLMKLLGFSLDITFRYRQRKKDRANAERMAKKAMDKLITRKEASKLSAVKIDIVEYGR